MDESKSSTEFDGLKLRLARNLTQLRKKKELTQEELSDMSGLITRHIQKIEAAEVNVTLKTLMLLASALRIDPEELLKK